MSRDEEEEQAFVCRGTIGWTLDTLLYCRAQRRFPDSDSQQMEYAIQTLKQVDSVMQVWADVAASQAPRNQGITEARCAWLASALEISPPSPCFCAWFLFFFFVFFFQS